MYNKHVVENNLNKHLQCRGVAQFGSARALGAWGRRFESFHPDHFYIKDIFNIFLSTLLTRVCYN